MQSYVEVVKGQMHSCCAGSEKLYGVEGGAGGGGVGGDTSGDMAQYAPYVWTRHFFFYRLSVRGQKSHWYRSVESYVRDTKRWCE